MARLARHCLGCNQLTKHGPRCPACDTANHNAAYGGEWRKTSRQQRQAVPWCQCQGECRRHVGLCAATTDLTADHVVAHARGGTAADGVLTLCRACNAAKSDRA